MKSKVPRSPEASNNTFLPPQDPPSTALQVASHPFSTFRQELKANSTIQLDSELGVGSSKEVQVADPSSIDQEPLKKRRRITKDATARQAEVALVQVTHDDKPKSDEHNTEKVKVAGIDAALPPSDVPTAKAGVQARRKLTPEERKTAQENLAILNQALEEMEEWERTWPWLRS